jgi:uncharacterized integral membrane protein
MADEEPTPSGPATPAGETPVPRESPASGEAAAAAEPRPPVESRGARFRRKARRGRLYLNAFGAAALLIYVVAFAASNTRRVKVDWVFGSSSPSLVWVVLLAAVLGWLLGLLVATVLRRRTRPPRLS